MWDDLKESAKKKQQELLSAIRNYKKPIHPDFAWWKERSCVKGGSRLDSYDYNLRSSIEDENLVSPPEHVLRTLDKFESFLTWLDAKPIAKDMSSYEKAKIACQLLEMTNSRDLSVSLDTDSFDINLKGDREYPVTIESGYNSNPLKIEMLDS